MFEFLEKNKKAFVYFPLIVYWLFLLFLTSLPSKELPTTHINDKVEHFSAYFILGLLLSLTLLLQNKFNKMKSLFFRSTLIIIGLYAALDEFHQLFIPGRDCDLLDWTADIIGAFLGILFLIFLKKIFQYKEA